ncbi:MAG: Gfo/Idh/MocA family oxidoreductase [Oscillospiraceae bacterium]|nr:Gfo/Idh/MocA family oxidoreductase [Oscillospiraceae bacterium]
MSKIRIGITCPSEIANRRFLPAVTGMEDIEYVGVGVNTAEERYGDDLPSEETVKAMLERGMQKAESMKSSFGGRIFPSYESIVTSPEIDAIYIPLPPALHYRWAKMALEHGKHVLVEKPATISLEDTDDLIKTAEKKGLALHENYMFIYHKQLEAINDLVRSGEIGDVRLYRISFGFPMRAANDFRYSRAMGGGALLDAGGYTIRYASHLLGETAEVRCAVLNGIDTFEVDMYGSGALINSDGACAQIAFGMDNEYKCELEIWGSKGTFVTGRVLTAPAGFTPTGKLIKGGKETTVTLPEDDAFRNSIGRFCECITSDDKRRENYRTIEHQAELVRSFMQMAN